MSTHDIILILIIGLFAGILSGLVGVGGGIILVPALVYFLSYTQHQAQGTSLGVLSFPVVIIAFITYYSDCKKMGVPIDFKIIGLLAAGFLIGGYFGSKLALKIDNETLKKIFAIILFYTGFKMLGWDAWLLKWVKNIF
ncbi:MAG: sulfite exporter TauE/SafE family protein [Flavihumibacter sp.]|nr:sulfite exporter TauE/SafE family protein [Flavihumibacter sp.]